jgi:hypothetical protein
VWSSDFEEEVWTDSANDARLLDMISSPSHPGQVRPEDNFGFSRDELGIPSSDPDRLRAFIERELDRR